MTNKINLESKEYHPREMLEVEVDSYCRNLPVVLMGKGAKLKEGKQTINMLASEYLDFKREYFEPNADEYEALVAKYNERKEAGQITGDEWPPRSGVVLFHEEKGRYPKQLKTCRIVGSKGIQTTDNAAREERLIQLLERASQKDELFAALLEKLTEGKGAGKNK